MSVVKGRTLLFLLIALVVFGIVGLQNQMVTNTNVETHISDPEVSFKSPIQLSSTENRQELPSTSVLTNQSFVNNVLTYLKRTQDDASERIPSMDIAYFLGMSLTYLEEFETVPANNLKNETMEIVNSAHNPDGGYGNWRDARSSAESTFQALQLLSAYGLLSDLTLAQANQTLQYIQNLKTSNGGYYPLSDWDVPDISSTYRGLWTKEVLKAQFPALLLENDIDVEPFLIDNFNPPFFISGASGYAEVQGGQSELLASLYSLQSFEKLNLTDPYAENVAKFLDSLIAPNGGVAGYAGGLPTTGFTASGIQLYLILSNYSSINVNDFISSTFLDDALDYLRANKQAGSGFSASERDRTAELSSTFFCLRIFTLLKEMDLLSIDPDLSGISEFLLEAEQPILGFGDYPGDIPELSHTTKAILTGQLLGNTSWFNPVVYQFITDCYDAPEGGFGFRPFTKPLVKYSYNAIRVLRSLQDPLTTVSDIKRFLLDSQNDDGGFGQDPNALFSYLTHTYWAISALYSLGELNNEIASLTAVLSWLSTLRKLDGSYGNYLGANSSLISSYRAVQILSFLEQELNSSDPLASSFLAYQKSSGGFVPYQNQVNPTMEATYYGIVLAQQFDVTINLTKVSEFIMTLHNEDGGFGLRPGFSSRVTSTYYAILALRVIENIENNAEHQVIGENVFDVFAPIIEPTFVPKLDTNKTVYGTYGTSAKIKDPEGGVASAWIETEWQPQAESVPIIDRVDGLQIDEDSDTWIFTLGPFDKSGFLKFRIYAVDTNSNEAVTLWYYLHTTTLTPSGGFITVDIINFILPWIAPLFLVGAVIDGAISYQKRRKAEIDGVKMIVETEESSYSPAMQSLNLVYLFLLAGAISFLARLLLGDALLILENSLFLFRFLLGALVILFGRYILGIRTFGLFAPVVLVISMLTIGPFWGLFIFLNVFILGYIVRTLISPYNLALGYRIGLLMVFSICYIGLLELIGEVLKIEFLSGSILVPVIITPWFIDRYVMEIEQDDPLKAFTQLMLTLVVSIAAFIVMSIDLLVRFVTLNPEIWIIIIAGLVYFGRTGQITLLDKRRFNRLLKLKKRPLTLIVRNRDYIARYNASVLYPIINKFNMKEQFDQWRVPTAELLAIIENENDLPLLMERLTTEERFLKGFVVKPSQSFGGKGILVVRERNENGHFLIGETVYHPIAIETELRRILQGEYLTSQLTTKKDIALIEERISSAADLATISVGLPDIRVIVFRGIPVMAMARLPTKESGGKANLKQGAIGAAISLLDGVINRAERKGIVVQQHPDTGNSVIGFKFNSWQEILATACLAQKASALGYAGVDIVIDEASRPLVLEINKRPGLEIQNVNQSSLLDRMKQIEDDNIDATDLSPLGSVQVGINLAKKYWEIQE